MLYLAYEQQKIPEWVYGIFGVKNGDSHEIIQRLQDSVAWSEEEREMEAGLEVADALVKFIESAPERREARWNNILDFYENGRLERAVIVGALDDDLKVLQGWEDGDRLKGVGAWIDTREKEREKEKARRKIEKIAAARLANKGTEAEDVGYFEVGKGNRLSDGDSDSNDEDLGDASGIVLTEPIHDSVKRAGAENVYIEVGGGDLEESSSGPEQGSDILAVASEPIHDSVEESAQSASQKNEAQIFMKNLGDLRQQAQDEMSAKAERGFFRKVAWKLAGKKHFRNSLRAEVAAFSGGNRSGFVCDETMAREAVLTIYDLFQVDNEAARSLAGYFSQTLQGAHAPQNMSAKINEFFTNFAGDKIVVDILKNDAFKEIMKNFFGLEKKDRPVVRKAWGEDWQSSTDVPRVNPEPIFGAAAKSKEEQDHSIA